MGEGAAQLNIRVWAGIVQLVRLDRAGQDLSLASRARRLSIVGGETQAAANITRCSTATRPAGCGSRFDWAQDTDRTSPLVDARRPSPAAASAAAPAVISVPLACGEGGRIAEFHSRQGTPQMPLGTSKSGAHPNPPEPLLRAAVKVEVPGEAAEGVLCSLLPWRWRCAGLSRREAGLGRAGRRRPTKSDGACSTGAGPVAGRKGARWALEASSRLRWLGRSWKGWGRARFSQLYYI